MKIRRVEIERFRGIKSLEWNLPGDFVCLIGPGDSTKTTILDAIEYALSPRWNIPFFDTDFYNAITIEPLQITVTVGELPDKLKSDSKFGLSARGWTSEGTLRDEPEEDDELVLSIRLKVDSSLEPSWLVINDRDQEGRLISAKDREELGCARLGEYLDRHFSWGRGSILSRITSGADSLAGILAEAARAAREALASTPKEKLANIHAAADKAKKAGAECGIAGKASYRPHLDVQAMSVGSGGLSLHDDDVPLRQAGLGTRRLLAVAMQREISSVSGPTLIDEIEHGLEPHRLRRLLQVLRKQTGNERRGQVILTTHAPVVLGELNAEELCVVRSIEGITQVLSVPSDLQAVVRRASEALLASKVIVCEGRTEIGLCRYLDQWWSSTGPSFSSAGVALADGNGQEAPKLANSLRGLGYDVVLFGDSDQPLVPDETELMAVGIRVLLWEGNVALEERLSKDLPLAGVLALIDVAMNELGEQSVRDRLAGILQIASSDLMGEKATWTNTIDETRLRCAFAQAAIGSQRSKQPSWFKRVDLAEEIGRTVMDNWSEIQGKDLTNKITALKAWIHGNG